MQRKFFLVHSETCVFWVSFSGGNGPEYFERNAVNCFLEEPRKQEQVTDRNETWAQVKKTIMGKKLPHDRPYRCQVTLRLSLYVQHPNLTGRERQRNVLTNRNWNVKVIWDLKPGYSTEVQSKYTAGCAACSHRFSH